MSFIINPFVFALGGGPSITWAGISGATESPAGVLTKTAVDGWGNCGAVSVETMAGDCRLTIYQEDLLKSYFIGIDPANSCNNFSPIDFAFFCNASGGGNADSFIYESGSLISTVVTGGTKRMLVIERVGTNYDYYTLTYAGARPAPDDAGRTHQRGPIVGTGSTLFVNLAMFFNANSVIDAANLIWEVI